MEWPHSPLSFTISQANNDVEDINEVGNIREVHQTISEHLFELVVGWIDQTDGDWNDKHLLEIMVS